jgi:uncharacterized protein YjaG (DUF416 family)
LQENANGFLRRIEWRLHATCAERLMPAYVAFSNRSGRGDPAALRGILTRLWDDLAGDRMQDSEVQSKIEACWR